MLVRTCFATILSYVRINCPDTGLVMQRVKCNEVGGFSVKTVLNDGLLSEPGGNGWYGCMLGVTTGMWNDDDNQDNIG